MTDNETWHIIVEIMKAVIAPTLGVLGYLLNGMKISMKQLEKDISEIKNNLGVHNEKMRSIEDDVHDLRSKVGDHDKGFIEFYKEIRSKQNG